MNLPNINSPQRIGKEYDDWNVDEVDSIALLRQEPAETTIPIEEAAEECDRGQAHADGEDGVPERIGGRLPGPVTRE